tara:strand:+ start:1420 stop:3666 length:2247 start_codon:yes stop_codon:yes gene_type:complete
MKTAFVFPSKAVEDTDRLFKAFTDIEYDSIFLCSENLPKILKKNIDLDMSILEDYDLVCPVGAEALKYVCGLTGITKYNGILTNEKYVPLLNPALLEFKPQYRDDIQAAFTKVIHPVLEGTRSIEAISKDYRYNTDNVDFQNFLKEIEGCTYLIIDIETTSLSPRKGNIIGVAFSTKDHQGIFVNSEIVLKNVEKVQELINDTICVFHNGKFDMQFLSYEYGLKFPKYEDTMLLHYTLQEAVGTHGLKQLALKYTDLGDYDRELDEYKKTWCRKNKILLKEFNFGMLPIEILVPYAQKDGDATSQLYNKFKPLVTNNEHFSNVYDNLLIPATEALMHLESNGGPINIKKLQQLSDHYQVEIEECTNEILLDKDVMMFERINEKAFNPNSTQQLQDVLFKIKKLTPIKKTEGGKWSVDKEVLDILKDQDSLVEAIADLRSMVKLKGTYIDNIKNGIDMDGRLRSSFNIHGTTSGRLSSSGVLNYQNIPRDNKDIKKLFTARDGYQIVQGDLKTAEVYCAAVLSNDKFLQSAFISNLDFHSYIAKQIFNLPCEVDEVKSLYPDARQNAKAITFGIMYQAGPYKIAEEAKVPAEEAKEFIKKYFKEASSLESYIKASNDFIQSNAFIYSFFGRKRRLPEVRASNRGTASHAKRSGVNFLVQSVASDINLLGTIDAIRWIKKEKLEDKIIPFTLVHDSVVAEVHEDYVDIWCKKLVEFMQRDRGIMIKGTPIGVDLEVGPSWGELSDYEQVQ